MNVSTVDSWKVNSLHWTFSSRTSGPEKQAQLTVEVKLYKLRCVLGGGDMYVFGP